ncbi:MAG: glutaredoxin [Coxiella sp. DG_40]|nr:MAG: glutaredoxin [Coxiella sp. DG_40]
MTKKVIIYTVAGCPKCYSAKEYLKSKNINFEEFDVRKNREKANEMIEKSGQRSAPVIDIEGTLIIGFKQEEIENALKM